MTEGLARRFRMLTGHCTEVFRQVSQFYKIFDEISKQMITTRTIYPQNNNSHGHMDRIKIKATKNKQARTDQSSNSGPYRVLFILVYRESSLLI